MTEISCILVDDEQSARNVLSTLLENNFPEITIKAKCKNVTEAVEQINTHNPKLVFLDVQMPNYAGYELVNFFNKINFEIIFVTAYDSYAIKAFELSAIDYLVKPVSRVRLSESIYKLKLKLDRTNKIEDYKNLLDSIKKDEFETIILPELGNKRLVKLADIIAVEANGAYSDIHLKGNKKITISKNLTYFENLLPENNLFFRTHRGWIVNLNSVQSYNKSLYELVHEGGLTTIISRRKMAEFESIYIKK
ncbi:MAG: LytR/AlgR family response regulator transcription factor [Flavobacteriales bacterium]